MTSEWRFDAIGTPWSIGTPDPIASGQRTAITDRIETFDRTWSRFRADATVQRLRTERSVDLGPDAPAILAIYDRLFTLTAGSVSPLVGGALEQLGYGAGYRLTPQGGPVRVPSWADCELDGTVLRVPEPVVLDIGAVGKGWLAGQVAAMVDQPCVVDASGDLVNRSGRTLRVALEDPDDPTLAIAVAEVPDGQAICGSASNRRRWADDLHHVLDARSGRPTREVVAAWAGGPDAGWADGLASAAFFTADLPVAGHWWAALDRDHRLVARGLPGEVFA
ncbi:FAD:protein FMN transferase [Aeromicrobium senzhongii]|uniref:FAD:protein FMN transferase n=1 Tax=Aeromicrobium senzhongii TaxID=2663859 RepID=A0ABX6SRW1_9ACTN|nr:FAD:protein FMN transferase [Aeromicrobium senzhongii]MTB88553.1 FAD:protein FMN transferase [Aeromicrobium senzhongii]QNL94133.1 FAD:protein FMN transferase [Aeromicrobium senzhongii]